MRTKKTGSIPVLSVDEVAQKRQAEAKRLAKRLDAKRLKEYIDNREKLESENPAESSQASAPRPALG